MSSHSEKIEHSSLLAKLMARAKQIVSRGHDLAQLSDNEIDEIARELNLSGAEFNALARETPGSTLLLKKRLQLLGLSETEIAARYGDVLRDLERVCGWCQEKRRCAAELDRQGRPVTLDYCPNEQTLQALQAEPSDAAVQKISSDRP